MITGIDHVTINMMDRDASFKFYEEVLGLKRLNEVDMGDHKLTYFFLNGVTRLELIEYYNDDPGQPQPSDGKGIYRHVALITDDIGEIFERCVKSGVEIMMEPTEVEKLEWAGMLIRDPNGVELEILQKKW